MTIACSRRNGNLPQGELLGTHALCAGNDTRVAQSIERMAHIEHRGDFPARQGSTQLPGTDSHLLAALAQGAGTGRTNAVHKVPEIAHYFP